jgi:hypothetical protein
MTATSSVKKVTRSISREVERVLWARAAGRCEFDGCNRLLYKSPVTQEKVNISEKAHIYSFSMSGPRGRGPFSKDATGLNYAGNLMLVCHDCHKKIDQDKRGERYPADLLLKWKNEHEKRILIVGSIAPSKKSHVLLYGANIGNEVSKLQPAAASDALFPDWYPAEQHPTFLSMSWEEKDKVDTYWQTEAQNLRTNFNRQVRPLIDQADPLHFSVFALAPMPLMILLGTLLTDKIPAQTYQLHREPIQTWKWLSGAKNFSFRTKRPKSSSYRPVLVISLSDSIDYGRVTAVLGNSVSIWELTIAKPHNDFLRSKDQVSLFRKAARSVIAEIGRAHGKAADLSIFPAMPVACSIEFGRVRMPKIDIPWTLFDQNSERGGFIPALKIGAQNE